MSPINPSPHDLDAGTPEAEAAALGRQFEALYQPTELHPDVGAVFCVPKGREIVSLKKYLDEYRTTPERRKGTATLTDAESFIAHVNRFASAASAVFAKPDKAAPAFTAVYDYHPAGEKATAADWLQHRAVYAPALSDEWKAWMAHNGRPMSQTDFAQFIEDRITDLVAPSLEDEAVRQFVQMVQGDMAQPGDLLALSRGLQVNVASTVKNAITLSSGEIAVQYEEQHRDGAGAPIKVKNLFQIAIPVFYAGARYRMPVRLRYRLTGGNLSWTYLLYRPEVTFDDAFRGIVSEIQQGTTVPVYLGAPEG